MSTKTKYFNFPLRPQQENVFRLIKDFAVCSTTRVFILKGYAGTGKTTLMAGLIKWLEEEGVKYSLLATTGRAAKILSNKTKAVATTVHGHIYVFNELNEDLERFSQLQDNIAVDDKGQLSLMFDLRPIHSEEKKVYIIDEASMISDIPDKGTSFAQFGSGDLLQDILHFDTNGKFIFIGDPCQLAPVNQEDSPALSKHRIGTKYGVEAMETELTEIIRQSGGNGILSASLKLRNLHKQNPPVKFASLPVKGYDNIKIHSSHVNLLNHYIGKIKVDGFEEATLICQTNKHCAEINKLIRTALHTNAASLMEGDLLMVTQNNYASSLVNGDQVIVKKIGAREYRCGMTFLTVEVEELATKSSSTLLLLEDILNSSLTNLNSKQNKDLFIDYYNRMKNKGISQKDKKFKDNMLKDPYLNALKAVYGYAITCHKSQGGEWGSVYLYLDNKIHGIKKPGIYQWWYTSVTRAKNELHIADDWFIK